MPNLTTHSFSATINTKGVVSMQKTQSQRFLYVDILKFLAILAVVVVHITAKGVMSYSFTSFDFGYTLFINSLFRYAVPIFVMCSGVLFLSPEKEIPVKKLFSKYISRIIAALFLFSVFYEALEILIVKLRAGVFDKIVIETSLNRLLTFNTHYHLYYLYMVVILYLCVPVLKVFFKQASEKDVRYLLTFLSVISVFLPFLRSFYPFNTYFTGMTTQYHLNLTYGILTYFVAGYYFSHYPISKKAKQIFCILGTIGFFVTYLGTYFSSASLGYLEEKFLAGNSPNVFFMSLALFILVKDLAASEKLKGFFGFMSKASFCIYLIHDAFIVIFNEYNFNMLSFTPVLSIPVQTILIFSLSTLSYLLLKRLPVIKNII